MDDSKNQTPKEEEKITQNEAPIEVAPENSPQNQSEPQEGQSVPVSPAPARQKTGKEAALDTLIAKRQDILNKLKEKNPLVLEARRKISQILPALRGSGSGHTMGLIREAERLEFSIATEAYTPKKEKELIKQLREIRTELSKHKELDAARKKIDAERAILDSLLSEIKTLENSLLNVRKECDVAYSEVLAERKAAYEQRPRMREEPRHERPEGGRRFGREEKKRHSPDDDMEKYAKDYDDTVSMDEICVIEKKEKKKEQDAES
ncbi:MAG: hypothetical protein NT051_06410 [Candidatus Micrarchaeota archaeon]|nr:hypothetical protein [Candidatus Micrarchaeota archaeon]